MYKQIRRLVVCTRMHCYSPSALLESCLSTDYIKSYMSTTFREFFAIPMSFEFLLSCKMSHSALDTAGTASMLPREKGGVVNSRLKVRSCLFFAPTLPELRLYDRYTEHRTYASSTCPLYRCCSQPTFNVGPAYLNLRLALLH